MSSIETFTPKNHKQNGNVIIEAIQMRNEIVENIIMWMDKKNIEVHQTKTSRGINIVSIMIPVQGGSVALRYSDYLVKYPDGGFVVVSKEQFHKRYESATSNVTDPGHSNPWGWGK